MNIKPSNISSHRWGLESLETREVLRAQDACVGKLIQKLNARVGEGNYVVTITADHGMMPLPELVNGHRIFLSTLLERIDKKFRAKISLGGGFINLWFDQKKMQEVAITNEELSPVLDGWRVFGPREKWPAYLAYRPDERLFFTAYTYEQVEAYVKANPTHWMANPYAGEGADVALQRELERLYAAGPGTGYLAYGADGDGVLPRIDGTRYFYRDTPELKAEREMFEGLPQTAR